jgi:uncharacterized membrane protein YgcG
MNSLARWTVALAAALLVAHAAALQPVDGTEVVVTDAGGHQLVGYGVVKNGFLMLQMGSATNDFVMVLVAPDGSVESYGGMRGAGGALLVDLPDGTRESLSALLGKNDIALRVVHKGGSSDASRVSSTNDGSSGSSASGGSDGGSSDGSGSSGDSTSSGDGSSSGTPPPSDAPSGDAPSSDGTDGP